MFVLKRVTLNSTILPKEDSAKYLGLHLDLGNLLIAGLSRKELKNNIVLLVLEFPTGLMHWAYSQTDYLTSIDPDFIVKKKQCIKSYG